VSGDFSEKTIGWEGLDRPSFMRIDSEKEEIGTRNAPLMPKDSKDQDCGEVGSFAGLALSMYSLTAGIK